MCSSHAIQSPQFLFRGALGGSTGRGAALGEATMFAKVGSTGTAGSAGNANAADGSAVEPKEGSPTEPKEVATDSPTTRV